MINRNYDPNIFFVSKKSIDFALLPNIGRFCKCGCMRKIEARKVTRTRSGKTITYMLKPDPDQVFATKHCKFKYYNQKNSHKSKSSLSCLISLKVNNDTIPYRELTLYLSKKSKQIIHITPEYKELWNTLEKLSRYSYHLIPLESNLVINP